MVVEIIASKNTVFIGSFVKFVSKLVKIWGGCIIIVKMKQNNAVNMHQIYVESCKFVVPELSIAMFFMAVGLL